MPKEKINILSLNAQGTANLTERSGAIKLEADDAISALQSISKRTHLEILLNQEEVDRLVSTGKFKITLNISNDKAGAAKAVREIHRMAMQMVPSGGKVKQGMLLGWLLLALLASVLGFAGVVLVLDAIQGTHTLADWVK